MRQYARAEPLEVCPTLLARANGRLACLVAALSEIHRTAVA